MNDYFRREGTARNPRRGAAVLLAGAFAAGALSGAVVTAPLDSQPSTIRGLAAPAPALVVHPGETLTITVVGATPEPSPTASPDASTSPPPSSSVSPSPSVPPSPTPVTCAVSAQPAVDAAPAGGTVDLGSCSYTSGITVTKALTILRGTFRQAGTAVAIRANDVTLDGTTFIGGNQTVRISADRAKLFRSSFTQSTESSIRLDPGADDTLIEANTIKQTVVTSHGYSPIAANDNGAGVGAFRNLTIRGNTIDQGPSGVAWFGIEVWGVAGLVIESNTTVGAGPMASIPRSDGAIIRNNSIDLSSTFWGMELADVDNAQVTGNVATGTSSTGPMWKALVQLHPGGGTVNGNRIVGNRLTNYPALVNAAGANNTVTDNCLNAVGQLAWGSWSGAVTLARNGPC